MRKEKKYRPERHYKGWGYEDWIVNNEQYCGKFLHFESGKRCSLHYHKRKDETFYLLFGRLEIILADSLEDYELGNTSKITLNQGECLHIWRGRVHQIIAVEESDLVEVSTQHFEEDSYRIIKGD